MQFQAIACKVLHLSHLAFIKIENILIVKCLKTHVLEQSDLKFQKSGRQGKKEKEKKIEAGKRECGSGYKRLHVCILVVFRVL